MAHHGGDMTAHQKHHAAERVVRRLQEHGHIAYFAGGCVRDRIMGCEPSDYDVVTDAVPERVKELFHPARLVGQAFGVVMVREKGVWVEVATFRTEWGYSDHRHPDHVQFSDAQHDAMRRDFTINGMFYDPVADHVLDYVGGQEDVKLGVIRAIGNPQFRFEEDYLRMLRAVRFAARFDYQIEPNTAQAIADHAPQLKKISRERIGLELRIMLVHPQRARAAELMQELGLDAPALLEKPVSRPPLVTRSLENTTAFTTVLTAWTLDRHLEPHGCGSRELLLAAMRRLKPLVLVRNLRKALTLSNEERQAMVGLFDALSEALQWPQLDIARRKRLLARHDWPQTHLLLKACEAIVGDDSLDLEALDAEARRLLAEGVAPTPWINGDDLVNAGFEPGPGFKAILDHVYDAQLAGRVTSQQEALALAKALESGQK